MKRQQQGTQLQCSICYVRCTKPVKCKGACQKPFCLKCAAQAKCSNDRCPHRCSMPFEIEPLPVPLLCPYNPKHCIIAIDHEAELNSHYQVCPVISEQQRQKEERKANYKCRKGHLLTFLTREALVVLYGKYWHPMARVACVECGQVELCRAMCLSCSTKDAMDVYCSDCRSPPCSKEKCPMGHKIKHRKKPGKQRYCDLCDVPAGLMCNSKVHGFCACDFDLCELCYSKLPQKSSVGPLKCNPERFWPFSNVGDDSDDSDYKA